LRRLAEVPGACRHFSGLRRRLRRPDEHRRPKLSLAQAADEIVRYLLG
jgi:hypothetical protein